MCAGFVRTHVLWGFPLFYLCDENWAKGGTAVVVKQQKFELLASAVCGGSFCRLNATLF
jgi:hypothetical protein